MSNKIQRFVLFNEQDGVYLGNCMGLGFWSLLDPVGQISSCTFESKEEAQDHIDSWDIKPEKCIQIMPVMIESNPDMAASIKEIAESGMPAWSPEETNTTH